MLFYDIYKREKGELRVFQDLGDKFGRIFKELRGHGKVRESHIQDAMKDVRRALLEADVNYKVVKEFVARVGERAAGKKVLDSLTPDQQIIKIVHEELVHILGDRQSPFTLSGSPACVMVCGLQGAGKTSFTAKLAVHLMRKGRKPLLVAADVYRPAAIEQLRVLGGEIGVPVYAPGADDGAREDRRRFAQGGEGGASGHCHRGYGGAASYRPRE